MSEDRRTLAELLRHYMAHYPNGQGDTQLSLSRVEKITGIPKATLGALTTGKASWKGVLQKMGALSQGLGIPMDEIHASVLEFPEEEGQ